CRSPACRLPSPTPQRRTWRSTRCQPRAPSSSCALAWPRSSSRRTATRRFRTPGARPPPRAASSSKCASR
ncbi:MAG: hypothetical protein AVDCRST_MAG77-1373, partial [uncultured Chloroflexi bacterium]